MGVQVGLENTFSALFHSVRSRCGFGATAKRPAAQVGVDVVDVEVCIFNE